MADFDDILNDFGYPIPDKKIDSKSNKSVNKSGKQAKKKNEMEEGKKQPQSTAVVVASKPRASFSQTLMKKAPLSDKRSPLEIMKSINPEVADFVGDVVALEDLEVFKMLAKKKWGGEKVDDNSKIISSGIKIFSRIVEKVLPLFKGDGKNNFGDGKKKRSRIYGNGLYQ
jgi:hypothetical protein